MNDTSTLSYRPLYEQVKTLLVKRLANHEWPPGSMLPSEIALAQEYKVSQGTVRKALSAMEKAHLVERRQGRGTFAAQHSQQRSLFQFFHFRSDANEHQLPQSQTISCSKGQSTAAEQAALELAPKAEVTRIQRVRSLNGHPVIYELLAVPSELFPGLDLYPVEQVPNTLYEFYETQYGVMVVHAHERLRAVAAQSTEAELLGIEPDTPLLYVDRLAVNIENRPVEWRINYCHTAHHYYLNELE